MRFDGGQVARTYHIEEDGISDERLGRRHVER